MVQIILEFIYFCLYRQLLLTNKDLYIIEL